MQITYESIEPLIQSSEQNGNAMQVSFKDSGSEHPVIGRAPIRRGHGLADVAKQSAKKNVMWSIRSAVSRSVYRALGHGILGRVGGDVARSMMSDATKTATQSFSDDEKKAAIVEAFESVASQFKWDGSTWVARGGATVPAGSSASGVDFSELLERAPIHERYDQGVLARMLVQLSQADGQITEEEEQFLDDFLPDGIEAQELTSRPPLTAAELGESTSGVRETMLILTWALAFCDEELDAREQALCETFGRGLGIDDGRTATLRTAAAEFVVERAIESAYFTGQDGFDAELRTEAFDLGARIGLERSATEQVEAAYKRKNGII